MQPISREPGTRERMLACIDDMELLVRCLLETVLTSSGGGGGPAGSGGGGGATETASVGQLTQLLLARDADLRQLATVARQQLHVHRQLQQLQLAVDTQNGVLLQLQRSLKSAETRLSSAIYQANQKLDSIRRSQRRPVSADELIRCAHRISSTDAVAAPLNWQQGDPRRPYPTETEMRRGLLGRLSELPVGSLLTPANAGLALATGGGGGGDGGSTPTHHSSNHHQHQQQQQQPAPGQFHWTHSGGEVRMTVAGGGSVPLGKQPGTAGAGGGGGDVEVMSTDSSTSSSSDSQ